MNSLILNEEENINKKLFTVKNIQRNGFVLKIQRPDKNLQKTRFINGTFNRTGEISALVDQDGNIFIINLSLQKFWNLLKMDQSITEVRFSAFKDDELVVATVNGVIYVVNVEASNLKLELKGHTGPINNISFSESMVLCLTSSNCEAIVWNFTRFIKMHVLNLNRSSTLKMATFTPATGNILACFDDDVVQIWSSGNYELKVQIPSLVWYNHVVKYITFSGDGNVMLLACRSPHLALFSLDNHKLEKFITLPEHISSLKRVDFIRGPNNGDCSRMLAVLSGRGIVYFYDIQQNLIVSELVLTCEISKISCSIKDNLAACILKSGDVDIYNISQYVMSQWTETKAVRATFFSGRTKTKSRHKAKVAKQQVKDLLEHEKLRLILKEHGEYPDAYRKKIWEQLLQLPLRTNLYKALIKNRVVDSFEKLSTKYPLGDKRSSKNLRTLLDNLVSWCQFLGNVEYLPELVFPFVKIFDNKPLACFEAVCTVIMNWCQFWFEYFPLPPINILSMVENLMNVHDAELLLHFKNIRLSAEIYAWPILKTLFSEVLTADDWEIFWDHVLTSEPAFLICGIVAYNISQRSTLLSMFESKHFESFFSTAHPIDVKKLLSKSYHVLNNSSADIHPRNYLHPFQGIDPGAYPNFEEYPRVVVNLENNRGYLKEEIENIQLDRADLLRKRLDNFDNHKQFEIEAEEKKRIIEMEAALKDSLVKGRQEVLENQKALSQLREKFLKEEETLGLIKDKILAKTDANRSKLLGVLFRDTKLYKTHKGYSDEKRISELMFQYSELIRNKSKIEQLLRDQEREELEPIATSSGPSYYSDVLNKNPGKLSVETEGMAPKSYSQSGTPRSDNTTHLKLLNLVTGWQAMDTLIKRVEGQIEHEKRGALNSSTADRKVLKLQSETQGLDKEVNKLLEMLRS